MENIPIKPICYEATGLGPQGLSWDIFGDGSICVIATAGHTAGSFCVLIRGKDQFVLLAEDTGYAPSSWMQMRLPGPLFNKKSMLKSLAWVKTIAESEKCLYVLASHDPHIKTQMIEL